MEAAAAASGAGPTEEGLEPGEWWSYSIGVVYVEIHGPW